MNVLSYWTKGLGVVICLLLAVPAFSESAPVYDADSLPQQFYNVPDQDQQEPPGQQTEQDIPLSPPEQDSTFVPIQGGSSSSPSQTTTSSAPSSLSPPMSTEQRLRRLEQQVNNMQSNDVAARTDSLQKQVQSLRGQVEQLTHHLQQMQDQQKSFYADVDKRMSSQQASSSLTTSSLEEETVKKEHKASISKPDRKTMGSKLTDKKSMTSSNVVTSNTNATDDQPNVAEEQQIYQTAYNFIKAKKYNDAVNALEKMLQKYPSGQFASNAHYWLGELYGLLGKHQQALVEFSTVVKLYPDSPRVPDAQLKVGLIYAAQAKWLDAKTAFKKVVNRYPGSASARLASEQLKQIKQASH